jgi:hypothetical protein
MLDRHHSTISREIERNGGPDGDRVVRAQDRCDAKRVRPKEHKLVGCRRLHDEVDTRLLATAARIRGQWTDPASTFHYPINTADQARGVGPLMGRYPDGRYDGDNAPPNDVGHPWVPCTANFAELYYLFATAIRGQQAVPLDALSAPFFGQLGIDATTPFKDAADLLDARR